MTSGLRERIGPYVIGAAVVIIWWVFLDGAFPADPAGLLGASGTFASVLVGFLATAKAIIMSISSSPTYKKIQSLGYSDQLMDYIKSAIYVGLFFLVVVTLGFFIDWKRIGPDAWDIRGVQAYRALWVVTAVIGLALYVRVIRIIFKVLKKA